MQLDNNYKKRVIHHIPHITIVCILLSSLPLEGCFKNTSLPFSKPSAIQPATVKPKHIDRISPLTKEEGEKVKEDILLENHQQELFLEATDRLSTHANDISKTTIVDNVKDHSEKPELLSKRDIEAQQKFAREQRENQLKNHKKLETETFKTRQGGYTIKFYQKEEKWRAKVTHENIKPMDLVAILDEEAISRLVNVNPIKNHLRVILPTVDKEGFVVYDTGFGGMKRNLTLLQSPSTSDNSASSAPSQPSDTTTTPSVTTTPQGNTSTSDISSSLTTGDQISLKSPGSSPVKKKIKSVAEDNSPENWIRFIGDSWSSSSEEGSKEDNRLDTDVQIPTADHSQSLSSEDVSGPMSPLSSQEQIQEDMARLIIFAQEMEKTVNRLKNTKGSAKEGTTQVLLALQQSISESLKFLSDEKDNDLKKTLEDLEYYKKLAEQGGAEDQYQLGEIYYKRWIETRKEEHLEEAIKWVNKAKDNTDPENAINLLQDIIKEIQEIFKQQESKEKETRNVLEEELDLESYVQIKEDNDDPLTTAHYYKAVTSIEEDREKDLDIVKLPLNPRDLLPKLYKIDKKIFRIRDVSGTDNRCFFNAAGLEVEAQIQNLRNHKNDCIVRYMIANEIATDRANISKEILDIIDYDQYKRENECISKLRRWRNIGIAVGIDESELPSHLYRFILDEREEETLNKLHLRSFSLKAFEAFIKHHIEKGRMMEIMHNVEGDDPDRRDRNYTSIDAIGYINKLGIKIYQADPKKAGELIMIHQFIPANATKVVYIYYDPAIVHFRILIPVEPSDEGEDESIGEKETSQEQPKAKTLIDEDPFNIILKYLEGEKIELAENELKALEKLQVLAVKAALKAQELLQELNLKAEKEYQEAEKLLADFEKDKVVKVIGEAINKYRSASYLGHKLAQDKLIKLRDSSEYKDYKEYVIKPNSTVQEGIKYLINTYTNKNNIFPEGEHPLKLSDLIIMELNLEKSPKRIEWGGSLPKILLSEPLFKMPDTEKYEDVIMIIDLAGKGKDETGYCVVKRYKDYYFIMAVGGLGGAYITDKEERLPARGEMLDEIARIIKKYNVSLVRIESNIDSSYEVVLSSYLAKKFVRARVEAYNEVKRPSKGEPQQAETKKDKDKDKDLGKATRIIDSLKDLLKEHKIIRVLA